MASKGSKPAVFSDFLISDARRAILKEAIYVKTNGPRTLGTSKTLEQKIREQIVELESTRQRFIFLRKSWAEKAVGIQTEVANGIVWDLEQRGPGLPRAEIWLAVQKKIVPRNVLAKPLETGRELFERQDVALENVLKGIENAQNTKKQAISNYRDHRFKFVLYRSKHLQNYMDMNINIVDLWPDKRVRGSRLMFLNKNIELMLQHYEFVEEIQKHGYENHLSIKAAPKLF